MELYIQMYETEISEIREKYTTVLQKVCAAKTKIILSKFLISN